MTATEVVESEPAARRPPLPGLPRRSVAQRVGHGVLYRLANLVERRRFRGRLPFEFPSDPPTTLERRGGRLRLVERVDGLTGVAACALNRDLVIDVCEAAGVTYFMVPEPAARRFRVGIAEEQWSTFIAALLALGQQRPVYIAVEARTASGSRRRWPELSFHRKISSAAPVQRELEVFRTLTRCDGGPVFERTFGCIVERWDIGLDGALCAPSRNARSTRVSPAHQERVSIVQAQREVSTFEAFASRNLFDIDFPIDAVYMWVNGSDPEWQERKATALGDVGEIEHITATTEDRFRDSGELKYSLRSLERFAPWIRHVYLVTDQQVPSWLAPECPGLTVVDHRELFGGHGRLPNFNSHAIGARLHHITGLAEHYVHFNDDFFLGREIEPGLFFQSNGVSKFFLSRSTLGFADPGTAPEHEDARRNVVNLLARDFGRSPSRTFYHTPIVQRRSTMFELEERYPKEFATTWSNQFRSAQDFEINSWLHHSYGYLTGKATPGAIRYDYFDLADGPSWSRMRRLLSNRDRDAFCINDSPLTTPLEQERAVAWLERYFPGPSRFER